MSAQIIRFVEDIKVQLEATGCSIERAIDREFRSTHYTTARLFALRQDAWDLVARIEQELGRRDPGSDVAALVRKGGQ